MAECGKPMLPSPRFDFPYQNLYFAPNQPDLWRELKTMADKRTIWIWLHTLDGKPAIWNGTFLEPLTEREWIKPGKYSRTASECGHRNGTHTTIAQKIGGQNLPDVGFIQIEIDPDLGK